VYWQEEEDRALCQHQVFHLLFDERLYFPPLTNPRRVLDCGYGQGTWTVAMAEAYEQSEVCCTSFLRAHYRSMAVPGMWRPKITTQKLGDERAGPVPYTQGSSLSLNARDMVNCHDGSEHSTLT